MDSARALIRRAIANFKNRNPRKVTIPKASQPLVAGFSVAAIKYMLGGTYRASFRPLNDAIIQGRIKGIVGIVGCSNPRSKTDSYVNALTRELIKRECIVLKTGCAAIASAKAGMLTPEAALEAGRAGLPRGLRSGRHPARAAHGQLRGQLAPAGGRDRSRPGRRARRRSVRRARPSASPRSG